MRAGRLTVHTQYLTMILDYKIVRQVSIQEPSEVSVDDSEIFRTMWTISLIYLRIYLSQLAQRQLSPFQVCTKNDLLQRISTHERGSVQA